MANVKARLNAYLGERNGEGPVVITRNGRPVAVLPPPQDGDDLERLLPVQSPHFQALLDQSRQSIAEGKGFSEKAFRRKKRSGAKPPALQSGPTTPRRPTRAPGRSG